VVAQARKGRGLATRLLDAAKARARDGLRLDVNAANARAVRFYAREGFRKVGEGVNPASGLPTLAMAWP
jgi:putative acetyltransferase